jgi:hypothetical protein
MGRYENVRRLQAHGAQIDEEEVFFIQGPLHSVALTRNVSITRLLVQKGVWPVREDLRRICLSTSLQE